MNEGRIQFEVVTGWERLPAGIVHRDVAAVGVDAADRVYLFTRGEARVVVYERDGTFVTTWGEGVFSERTHGLTVAPDGSIYCVDDGSHSVRRYAPDGRLLQTIGPSGAPSDTGYDGKNVGSITHGGPPFNRPTNLAVAPSGDLYVTDGYGNARVHRFAPDGTLLQSWGEPGTAPGEFNLPHGIAVLPDGRVVVADRENDRLQFFTPDGTFLEAWTDVQRPTQVTVAPDGSLYVSELWWRAGQRSFVHGPIERDLPARVSVFAPDGTLRARWGGPERCTPGSFTAPHDLCLDSHGDLYVAEVTWTFAGSLGLVPADCHTFQKFQRADDRPGA